MVTICKRCGHRIEGTAKYLSCKKCQMFTANVDYNKEIKGGDIIMAEENVKSTEVKTSKKIDKEDIAQEILNMLQEKHQLDKKQMKTVVCLAYKNLKLN